MTAVDDHDHDQTAQAIAQNTVDIAANTEAIETNLATLNAGGEERWKHIHASEKKIQTNTDDITVLNLVRLRRVQLRINVLAAFVLLALLIFALLLQHQATHTSHELTQLCAQVQANARTTHLPPATCGGG